ncbi:MAG: heme exporter protein CcmD [Citrobacter sp.]|uniref:heme exporter protein CcmD n=1 Tax=Citrobacter sp. TaxID=1896336 RepID=UPI003D149713
MTTAFASWSDFFAMGGYAFYVWLAVALLVIPLAVLVIPNVTQHRAILRDVSRQRASEARLRAAQTQREAA